MRKGASFAGAGAALLCLALLAGCSENDGQSQAPLARIEAVTAKVVDFAPRVTLTGTIQAQVQNDIIVGTVLTLLLLPALYVAWYRIEAPDETVGARRA